MKIICIGGFAQHGKDSSAKIFTTYFESHGKKCLTIKNADYLKFVCREYFGWNGLKDEEGRSFLQVKGTEEARDNNPDIWVNVVIEFLKAFGNQFDYIFISDVRFPNEILRLKENKFNVFTIWVFRNNFDNKLECEQKNHRSETSLIGYNFDYIISVENKMEGLVEAVHRVIKDYEL